MIIKKFKAKSLAKLMGVMYAIFGFIGGLIMSFVSLVSDTSEGGMIFGIGAVLFLPILYGLMGYVGGLISAWIYNVVAGKVGGIEIEVE